MTKLNRETQLIFGANAGNRSLTAFGTAKTDTPEYTTDVKAIQNSNYLQGWSSAILADRAPYEEDTNGLLYMITRQLAYLYQSGIPEYDANTVYYMGNTVTAPDGSGVWYQSLTNDNTNNPLSDTINWRLVELAKRTIPLFSQITLDYVLQNEDAIGWALQGSLVNGSIYTEAFNKLLALYNNGSVINYRGINATLTSDGRYLTALSNKNAVDNLFNNTGVADFYILDVSSPGFYLPKTSKFIQYTTDISSVNKYNSTGLPAPEIILNGGANLNTSTSGSHSHSLGGVSAKGTLTFVGYGGLKGTGVFKTRKGSVSYNASPNSSASVPPTIDFDLSGVLGTTSVAGAHTHTLDLSSLTATASGGLYGLSNTVQPASSNKLLYYLVGDTAL